MSFTIKLMEAVRVAFNASVISRQGLRDRLAACARELSQNQLRAMDAQYYDGHVPAWAAGVAWVDGVFNFPAGLNHANPASRISCLYRAQALCPLDEGASSSGPYSELLAQAVIDCQNDSFWQPSLEGSFE